MLAQSTGGDSGPPPPTGPPPELPIDSGIVFLVAAALVYGGYIALKRRRTMRSA